MKLDARAVPSRSTPRRGRPAAALARLAVVAVAALAQLACGPGSSGGADAGPEAGSTCRSDRECSAAGLLCDRANARCVECLAPTDCIVDGQLCLGNRCITPVRCTSSRMCPGQVCDLTLSACVDCMSSVDCPMGSRCTDARVCEREGPLCVANSSMCVDGTTQRVCRADGSAYDTTRCASGESCTEGRCQRPMPVCGANGQACCDGARCNSGLSCVPLVNTCAPAGPACNALGATCSSMGQCCSGATCRGTPTTPHCCSEANGTCRSSADCCGFMLCGTGGRCGCQQATGACAADIDCCSRRCLFAPGSTSGTCA